MIKAEEACVLSTLTLTLEHNEAESIAKTELECSINNAIVEATEDGEYKTSFHVDMIRNRLNIHGERKYRYFVVALIEGLQAAGYQTHFSYKTNILEVRWN